MINTESMNMIQMQIKYLFSLIIIITIKNLYNYAKSVISYTTDSNKYIQLSKTLEILK